MNYHLQREGQEAEVLTLDELRRRRESGALSGTELVWREGMPDWQWLDSVLEADAKDLSRLTPPPLPRRTSLNKLVTALFVILGVIFLVEVIWISKKAVSFFHPLQTIQTSSSGSDVALAKKNVVTIGNFTEADARNRARAFRVKEYVEGYETRGQRNPSSDYEALQLIKEWIAVNYGGPEATNLPSPADLSDRLAANPACTDPLVLMVTALNSVEHSEKISRLERAVNGFKNSNHKAYPKFYATMTLAGELRDQPDRFTALDAEAVQLFRQCFEDGSWSVADQSEIAELFINGPAYRFFSRNEDSICDIAAAEGKPFEWLALCLSGERHISQAWRARGGGYSSSVTKEGWRDFSDHLAAAREAYTDACKLRPDLPLAPCRMIYVSMGDSNLAEMRSWFDRTVAVQIDYPRAWAHLRWGLRPRWYGSLDSMRELGVTAIRTRRFDTDVPRKFFDVVTDLEEEMEITPGQHIYSREEIWPHLEEMYEGYIAAPSQLETRDGWRSTYSAVAYLVGRYDVARRQLEATNWKPWPDNLTKWGVELSLMPLEVAARTGSASNEVTRAESSRESGDVEAAVQAYTKLSSEQNLDERTSKFIQCRLASLRFEQRFQTGDWIDFLPKQDDDPNWVFVRGKHRHLGDGALEIESGPDGHFLFCTARIGSQFEVQGDFEIVRPASGDYQAGLVMGVPDVNDNDWAGFQIKRQEDGDSINFSQGWSQTGLHRPAPLREDANHFRFRLQNGKARIGVNRKRIFAQAKAPAPLEKLPANAIMVGLGAPGESGPMIIRYRNLQIRKAIGQETDTNE